MIGRSRARASTASIAASSCATFERCYDCLQSPDNPMPNGSDFARRRTITVFLTQGLAGLLLMLWVTWLRFDQTLTILHRLQPSATAVIVILVAFATTLALLKFELTELI